MTAGGTPGLPKMPQSTYLGQEHGIQEFHHISSTSGPPFHSQAAQPAQQGLYCPSNNIPGVGAGTGKILSPNVIQGMNTHLEKLILFHHPDSASQLFPTPHSSHPVRPTGPPPPQNCGGPTGDDPQQREPAKQASPNFSGQSKSSMEVAPTTGPSKSLLEAGASDTTLTLQEYNSLGHGYDQRGEAECYDSFEEVSNDGMSRMTPKPKPSK